MDLPVLRSHRSLTGPLTPEQPGKKPLPGCPSVLQAPGRTRTGDLLITNQLLYQLSHGSKSPSLRGLSTLLIYYRFPFLSTSIFSCGRKLSKVPARRSHTRRRFTRFPSLDRSSLAMVPAHPAARSAVISSSPSLPIKVTPSPSMASGISVRSTSI